MRDKQWKAALQPLDLLRKAFPEDISGGSAYELLAQVHRQLEQPQQEQAILEEWIARDNDALDAQLRLLEIYASQQSWPALATVAERTLAVNPLLTSPHQQLSLASTALQKPHQAIPALQSLLALDPRDPADIHYRLAYAYHETNQPAHARRHVLQALEYAPRYRDAHRLLLKLGPAAPPADQQPQEKP